MLFRSFWTPTSNLPFPTFRAILIRLHAAARVDKFPLLLSSLSANKDSTDFECGNPLRHGVLGVCSFFVGVEERDSKWRVADSTLDHSCDSRSRIAVGTRPIAVASGTRPKVRLPSVPNLVIDADLTLSQLPPRKGSIPTTRAFPSTHTSLLPNAIPADSPSLVHGRDLLAPILALSKVGAFISVLLFRADRLTSSVPSPSPPPPTASPPPPPPPFASTPAPPLPSNPSPSVSTSLGSLSLTSSSSYAASTDAGKIGRAHV